MPLTMQEVLTTDTLRKVYTVHLFDPGTATIATMQDGALIRGLSGHGGTIQAVTARAGTTPTGTVTSLTYDVNRNGTTIFTSTKVVFPATTGGSASTTGGSLTSAQTKVFNGDIIGLDCDAIADGTAGAGVAVTIQIRADEPND